MFRLRTFIILIVVYLIAFITIKYDFNLFYPYHLIKNYLFIPVMAINNNQDLVLSTDYQESLLKEMKDDIQELKDLLNIQKVLSDYSYINASVIERNRSYWFNTITIDKGANDGIQEKMAVVSSQGLIGKISKVFPNMSEIKLITTSDLSDKTSVVIAKETNTYGIIDKYQNNYLEVVLITKNGNVQIGDKIQTSGMGGVYPSGILIGTVSDIKKNKYDIGEILLVTPSADFNKLKYVSVLKRN